MGFFSSIINFLKDVVKSVLGAIARIFHGVFGSTTVAALAMFVIGFMLMGPASFATLISNPVLFLSQCLTLTCFIGTAMVLGGTLAMISAFCPKLGQALGFIFGLIGFFYTTLTLLTNFWPAFAQSAIYTSLMGADFFGVGMTTWIEYFTLANAVGTAALIASLAEGVDEAGNLRSPYAQAYVDGVFAIPVVVAEVADAAVSAVADAISDSFWLFAAIGVGAYFLLKSRPGASGNGDITVNSDVAVSPLMESDRQTIAAQVKGG